MNRLGFSEGLIDEDQILKFFDYLLAHGGFKVRRGNYIVVKDQLKKDKIFQEMLVRSKRTNKYPYQFCNKKFGFRADSKLVYENEYDKLVRNGELLDFNYMEEKGIDIQSFAKKKFKENKIEKYAYIYAILIDDKVVYIGKTKRKLGDRIQEHLECVWDSRKKSSQQKYLYKAMRENNYRFELLHDGSGNMTNRELEELEKKLIETLKPAYNYEGVKVPYRFSS